MNTSVRLARRGSAAATSALAATVLTLGLTGCGDDPATADNPAPTAPSTSTSATTSPSEELTTAAPEPTSDDDPDGSSATPSSLGMQDDAPQVDFPGVAAAFSDGSSAAVDGRTLIVTTAAEETATLKLPTESEGYFLGTSVDLDDAGTGYVLTQSGGEYLRTFLVVLDDGELYLPEPDDEVVFGQFAGEGPFFETYTTDDGAHLVTHLEDAPTGAANEYYEWTVEDRQMVPTLLT
ncbi:MAG: hypothetical protein JWN84_3509 [Nocardioides sp.]|nr:hypothetical protein [Nocardioides sp.]